MKLKTHKKFTKGPRKKKLEIKRIRTKLKNKSYIAN
jgi:hypothetical protein